jgi:hypothetical protein
MRGDWLLDKQGRSPWSGPFLSSCSSLGRTPCARRAAPVRRPLTFYAVRAVLSRGCAEIPPSPSWNEQLPERFRAHAVRVGNGRSPPAGGLRPYSPTSQAEGFGGRVAQNDGFGGGVRRSEIPRPSADGLRMTGGEGIRMTDRLTYLMASVTLGPDPPVRQLAGGRDEWSHSRECSNAL